MAGDDRQANKARPLARTFERASGLDPAAKAAAELVRRAIPPGPVKDAISGTWQGHAVHPPLTDVVIGTWISALIVDVAGGRNAEAADRLVAAGVLAALPTATTGLADWADAEPDSDAVRRVGAVHALGNVTAIGLQVASLVARRRGARRRGVALSLGANALIGLTGYLGGHLTLSQGIGVDQTVFDPGPQEWTDTLAATDLGTEPATALVGDTPVLLVRAGEQIFAVHNRCSHRGCPLDIGTVEGETIECACHGSRFSLRDGHVERGPTTAPQPAFDVREVAGRIELRRRPEA